MEFLKNHYEKVLLSAVLLGLAVVVAILPMKVPSATEEELAPPQAKAVPLDLATNEAAMRGVEKLPPLVLTGTNNLYSPILWRQLPDGSWRKILSENEVGIGAVKVMAIHPLYFGLRYDGYTAPTFTMIVRQETNTLRRQETVVTTLNEKKQYFRIIQADGLPDNPTNLVVELNDGTTVSITKDKPYNVVVGYSADLNYPLEQNRTFLDRRPGSKLVFDQETNNIVDISSNDVVLSSASGKRVTINYKPAP